MFPKLTPIVKNLVILNVIVYILSNSIPYLYEILPAYYPFSPNFKSWQIISHMFMHAPLNSSTGIMHIAFNMMTLWSFGPVLEQILGSKKFTLLYFVSGLGAFLLFNVWNFYEVQSLTSALQAQGVNVAEIFHYSNFNYEGKMDMKVPQESIENIQNLMGALRSPMLGASGAIFGVIAAFATLFPDAKLMFMFIPFPIKAKYMMLGVIVISLFLQFSGNTGGIAHLAHIGGAIVGFFFARNWKNDKYRIN